MLLEIYSIRDSGARFFSTPIYARARGQALREFSNLVKDPKSIIHAAPEHYDLYFLGHWDDNSGKHETLPSPEHISKAIEHVDQPTQTQV